MSTSASFLEYVLSDVLGHRPNISYKSMFGAYGIYQDGIIFALIAYDALYFKVGPSNLSDFEDAGCKPFVYEGKGKPIQMSYWTVPETVMEDHYEILDWVAKAVQASLASNKKNKK